MHQRREIAHGLSVTVSAFTCRAPVHRAGIEEANALPSVVLLRRGSFVREQRGAQLVADANQLLFFHPEHPYRIAHLRAGGDDCTIFTLPLALAEKRLELFARGSCPATPRLAQLHRAVLRHANGTALAREEAIAALLDEALRGPTKVKGRQDRDVVEAAKEALQRRPDGRVSLHELARATGVSPFQLSRTFSRATGVPLRRYALRLRLREAAFRLDQGEADLTALAHDLGFFDHSHFTNAFHSEWGVPPSRFRAQDLPSGAARERARRHT
jgi:AraC family transcriptional regulator